ncbi:M48 family metallopeptidase [Sphingomonas beigongshangi]|uniref:M48 family metallopeptidase n=1 Tax=Sphingomonas beigongshangi TaxID=2782540 RepID=UPI001AEEFC1C|nr:M48 family metallopeptidase [Sphingomonas beigongshangi]
MSAPSESGAATGAAHDDGATVWHYDGVSALRRRARLLVEGDALVLVEDGVAGARVPIADLVPGHADAGAASYGLKGRPGWRIDFAGPVPPALRARLPGAARYGGWVDRMGLWRAAAVFAAVAAVVVVIVLRTPAMVARLVPASVERQLGETMVGDFGRRGCTDAAGRAALATLARRIDPDDPRLEVDVVKLPMVNAVTLPGRRIVVFDGLIQAARSPDEVAGVVAHEIGHVRHRDVMEGLLRQFGLSVLLGGMEGHVGGYTNTILATAYSRDAEAKADGYAIQLLRDAKVSPLPTAAFFDRLGRGGPGKAERMLAYLATHPVSADRARRFRQSALAGGYAPALAPSAWHALRGICRGDTDRIDWRF